MIQKLTVSKIAKFTTNKEGKPLMTKAGKPYTSVRIQALEHGEKWLSGFGGPWNDSWQEGTEVTVEVTQNGQYLNFSKVNTEAILLERINKLEQDFEKMREAMKPLYLEWKDKQPKPTPKVAGTDIDYPTEEINVDDINI